MVRGGRRKNWMVKIENIIVLYLINWLTPWSRVLLAAHQDISLLFMQPNHCIYKNPPHLYPKTDHSSSCTPLQLYWRFILILSSHLCLDFPSGLFSWISPTKTPYVSYPLPGMCYIAICTAYLISLHFIPREIFGVDYRSWSSSLCSLLSPVTSSS